MEKLRDHNQASTHKVCYKQTHELTVIQHIGTAAALPRYNMRRREIWTLATALPADNVL
jgi:hypothetical protein